VGELKAQPLRHVARVRVDRAGGRNVFQAASGEHTQAVVWGDVRRRDVLRAGGGHGGDTRGHAERLEDALRDEIVPGRASGLARGFAGGEVHHVLITEARAKSPRRLEVAYAAEHFV